MRRIAWAGLASIAVLLTGYLFSALPAAVFSSTEPKVRFAVIGDFGYAGQSELDVANLVKSWNPEFIVTVGDNNYTNGSASTIDRNIGQYYHEYIYPYVGSYGQGADINRFFPALGNNEWELGNADPHLSYFTLPGNERYYDFTWGPLLHFFILDSDRHEPDGTSPTSTQGTWLYNAMAASNALWKVVVFHHAPYSSGAIGPTTRMQWPFTEWGADVVLTGHDHTYERLLINSIPYFVNGLGGRSRSSFKTVAPGSQVRYVENFGAMRVEANSTQMTLEFINRLGVLIDTYTLSANPLHTPPPGATQRYLYFPFVTGP
jgi:tartrate-resistant acid phosphatase type 5